MKHLILFLFSFPVLSQAQNAQLEINKQVWEPFIEAYRTNDADLFSSIHSDEILRISSSGLQVGNDYKNSMGQMLKSMEEKGQRMIIDFSFEKRIYKENIAYEVGFYKITWSDSNSSKDFYGRFHVVLRKINDVWKIAQDYDTPQVLGQEINQTVFNQGKQMSEIFEP